MGFDSTFATLVFSLSISGVCASGFVVSVTARMNCSGVFRGCPGRGDFLDDGTYEGRTMGSSSSSFSLLIGSWLGFAEPTCEGGVLYRTTVVWSSLLWPEWSERE